jgi:thymidylate synthase
MSNSLDSKYQQLLQDILDFGVEKSDRTGTGTKSIFGYTISHKMSWGFPLLTSKKMAWKSIVTELLWFLRGDTNIKYLVDNNCHIWNGDAYKNYLKKYENLIGGEFESLGIQESNNLDWAKSNPTLTQEEFINKIKTDDEFAKKWGELGPIYGKQWRDWNKFMYDTSSPNWDLKSYPVDQIANLISELKTNPDSRRLMVSAWNVGELDQMVLPPCHNFWQMYSVEKEGKRYLSMMVNIRSNDIPLGLPFNIASYGLLLEILAKEVNMVPDDLIINIGDAHIYLNQMEGVEEQLTREPYELPKLIINDEFWNPNETFLSQIEHITHDDFIINNYKSHPNIKIPLSN